MTRDDDDRGDDLDSAHERGQDGDSAPDVGESFQLPTGFAQALTPGMDLALAKMLAPIREQLKSTLPDYNGLVKSVLEPSTERFQSEMASIVASLPTFTAPMIDLPVMRGVGFSSTVDSMLKQIASQHAAMIHGLRGSMEPLFDPELLRGFKRRELLPPNLRSHADEINANQVREFLTQEGIPLYLVPRGRIALRLIRAQHRSARRRVLGDCYESIIDDCAAVLGQANRDNVGDELDFALDGLSAMRSGYFRSAQAMFTVTLDTLIYRFYPDQAARRQITNRKKGEDVPVAIEEMGVHKAMVWLPIWNAHEQFWKHKGDKVPNYYSRHASVHGVSPRQFSKRNCTQVLMLISSLIGYADRLKSSAASASA